MAKNKKVGKYTICNSTDIMNLVEELINISSNNRIDIKNSFRMHINNTSNSNVSVIYPEFLYITMTDMDSDKLFDKDINYIDKCEVGADLINDSVNDIINRFIEKCNNLGYLFICPYVPELYDRIVKAWNFISKYKMVDLHIVTLNESPSNSNDATEVDKK